MAQPIVTLELLTGQAAGTRYRISGGKAVVGRSSECEIALNDVKGLSRRHAEIVIEGSAVFVRDLGSQNGTLVEGQRLPEAKLAPGDTVRMGNAEFRVHIGDEAHAVARAGAAAAPAAQAEPPAPAGMETAANAEAARSATVPAEAATRRQGARLKAILLVVVIAAVLYFVDLLDQIRSAGGARTPHIILQVREKRVLWSDSDWDEIEIKSPDGEIARWRRFDGMIGRKDTGRAYILEGRRQGRGHVFVKRRGSVVGHLVLHVAGVRPPDVDPVLPAVVARERAERKATEAAELRAAQPYEALKRLELAYELYLHAGETGKAQEVEIDRQEVRRELSRKLTELYQDAYHALLSTKGRMADPVTAREKLNQIKSLVPDEESVDWQLAHLLDWRFASQMARRGR